MKAKLIVGGAKSGKSHQAHEAAKRIGHYIITTWDELREPFGLEPLMCSPQAVIVEDFNLKLTAEDVVFLKQLLSDREFAIEIRRGKRIAAKVVPAPLFIFTVLTPPVPDFSQFVLTRFELIDLGSGPYCADKGEPHV